MDERQVFLAVVEAGGFTAAADRLGLTPASVSRRIKALEQRLGVRLLQRTTRRVRLTEVGERYYRELGRLLADLDGLEQAVSADAGQAVGELRVAAPVAFGQRRLVPLLARFCAEHPRLRVSLTLDDAPNDLVAEGIDLSLRIAYPADSSLVARPIAPVPLCICAAPDYLQRRGTPRSLRDMRGHARIHYSLLSAREEWLPPYADVDPTPEMPAAFACNNGDALIAAAVHGMGLLQVPVFMVEQELADGRLVRLLEGCQRPPLTLAMLYPSRQQLPAKTRLFVEFLKDQLGEV